MSIIVKNVDSIEHVYSGQTISAGSQYTIQLSEWYRWASNSSLITDISNEKIIINNGVSDILGIANQISYLLGQDTASKDTDGAYIQRNKAAKTGWTYHMTAPELETSVVGSLYHKNVSGDNLNETTLKFYDINNTELTTQETCDSSCIKTVMTFEPFWDYEIIGGTLKTLGVVTQDIRIWVIAVPDIPANYGGSKIMVQGVNLRFIDPNNGIETDGRAAKYLTYCSTNHTNKLQLIVKHPVGHKEKLMLAFEVYRN